MVVPALTAERSSVELAGTVRSLTTIDEQLLTTVLIAAALYVLMVHAGSTEVGNLTVSDHGSQSHYIFRSVSFTATYNAPERV